MADLRLFGTKDEHQTAINEARSYVGSKAEALTVSAADALIVLWGGGSVELDDIRYWLVAPADGDET